MPLRLALAVVLLLSLMSWLPAANAQQATAPALHVQGNQIVDASGQAAHLRGVDRSGSEYMCLGSNQVFDGPSDQVSVSAMRAWQINVVRIPINEDCWLGINGQPQQMTAEAYQSAIVAFVGLLNQNGIAAIIDLQWAAPGASVSNGLTPMPDADHAPAFWQSVATTFKGNQSVVFDLFNEPFPDNNSDTAAAWTCLRDGGTCPGVTYEAAGTQSLVDAIRATGSTNIIGVPGVQYTDVLSQWLTFKPNDATGQLVALWHSYAGQACSTQACWDSQVKPVAAVVPLIATEIGENDCQDVYIGPEMAWLDANAGGNYLGWAWNTYDCGGFPSLISNFDGTPTSFGVGFRNHLLELSGMVAPTPVPIPYFNGGQFPFGISVGSTHLYTAADGTVFYPDVAGPALAIGSQFFTPFTTSGSIGGTVDPVLYATGRQGAFGNWTINVPNGLYVVTLSAAPAGSVSAGEFGQDQTIQGQKVGTCVWTSHSGPPDGCPGNQVTVSPAVDQANTVSYTVDVFNQHLMIQAAASFGGGRTTLLNAIRVDRAGGIPPTPAPAAATPTPTVVTPTFSATPAPTATPIPCQALVSIDGGEPQLVPEDASFCGVSSTVRPTSTPTPTCDVRVVIDGQDAAVSRPPSFCTNQP